MANRILLLPDAIANQIAAGEVIQRPASAVKELLENAIDAGATQITLTLKEAGKVLIHVADDGCGMSDVDARMCFERHATSKIKNADDLWALHSYGFRGEAMPSIAAISQVKLQTCPEGESIGTEVTIEGGIFKNQIPWAGPQGTRIAISNLFFNMAARRNFLKSDQVEMQHVLREVIRVALAFPSISFTYVSDGSSMLQLRNETLSTRIRSLFGKTLGDNLVRVTEKTTVVSLDGYVGKPIVTKKKRGDQFLFVNQRFIKDPGLHQAIILAFHDLLPPDHHPTYFLNLELPPEDVDVNIHPTKTEVKFRDDRTLFAVLKSAVKRALSQYGIMPSIDFSLDPQLAHILPNGDQALTRPPYINLTPNYSPFGAQKAALDEKDPNFDLNPRSESILRNKSWGSSPEDEPFSPHFPNETVTIDVTLYADAPKLELLGGERDFAQLPWQQVGRRFAVAAASDQLWLFDIDAALASIYYSVLLQTDQTLAPQAILFPLPLDLDAQSYATALQHRSAFGDIGLVLRQDEEALVLVAIPGGLSQQESLALLEALISEALHAPEAEDLALDPFHHLAKLAVGRMAKAKEGLIQQEIQEVCRKLMTTATPGFSPQGAPTFKALEMSDLEGIMAGTAFAREPNSLVSDFYNRYG